MSSFNFADRYAEAGLAPGGSIITARQAPTERIVKSLTDARMLDLVRLYYGQQGLDLSWLRDEFIQEDAAFSLVNNQRECTILAAVILGAKTAEDNSAPVILALLTASLSGRRTPKEAGWLLNEAKATFLRRAVAARQPSKIDAKLTISTTSKLGEEIAAVTANDWPNLIANLGKVHTEAYDASKDLAAQASTAIGGMATQLEYMREETQMLWWLFGEHSRTLNRHFSAFAPGAAALVAGVDLGDLTTASILGPVAAPAMLERVLALAHQATDKKKSLASVLDGIAPADLHALKTFGKDQPSSIFPIMTAIEKAKDSPGAWYAAFEKSTGFKSTVELEPIELATQIYNEHLLGQLL